MITKIKHLVRVAKSIARENYKKKTRSPKWAGVEHAYRKAHPLCAACGGVVRLQVHHKQPYHLHPELELDEKNLIGLCMGTYECHLLIGHGDDFRAYNPNVESDAAIVLANPQLRKEYEARAKAVRRT